MQRPARNVLITVLTLISVFPPLSATWNRTADAQALSIGVTPSFVDITLDAGESIAQELAISNEGEAPFTVMGEVTNLSGADSSRSAVSWLLLEPGPIELNPGDTDIVTVLVQAPETAAVGGYFAQLTFTTGPVDDVGTPIEVRGQLNVPFLLAVDAPGDFTYQAEVERFSAVLEPDGRIGFRAEVTNTGNRHIFARTEIELFEEEGTRVGEVAFPEGTLILPGQTVLISGERSLLLEAGATYRAVGEIDPGPGDPETLEFEFVAEPPSLEIDELRFCTGDTGEPTFQFALIGDDDLSVAPSIYLDLVDGEAESVAGVSDSNVQMVWLNSTTQYSLEYPEPLPAGSYTLTALVRAGGATEISADLQFETGELNGSEPPLC